MKISICLSHTILLLCYSTWTYGATFPDHKDDIKHYGGIAISGIYTAMSRADTALARSVINIKHLKGDFGENIAGKLYLEKHLDYTGSWEAIAPRFGRQGIDQIFIKYDPKGLPKALMVGEVKYGTAKLQNTKRDGMQSGKNWTIKRVKALANRYISISESDIQLARRPSKLDIRHELPVNISGGRYGVFWRKNANDSWKFEGNGGDLSDAKNKIKITGRFLQAAGNNKIKIRGRLFEVANKNNLLSIRIKNVDGLEANIPQYKLKMLQEININLSGKDGRLATSILQKEIAKQLKLNFGQLSDKECFNYAKNISKNINAPPVSFANFVLNSSIKAGIWGALYSLGIESVAQIIQNDLNPGGLAKSALFGFAGTSTSVIVSQLTTKHIMTSNARFAVAKIASSIGISNSYMYNAIGGTAGMSVFSILSAYGGYFAGYYDSYTANKLAFTGVAGAGGAILAGSGMMCIATTFGTASTGTAISSLGGAAATKAALAWLGGGSIASGGGGVAIGTAVVGGVVTVAVLAATAIGSFGFNLYEESEQTRLLEYKLDELEKGGIFNRYADRLFR